MLEQFCGDCVIIIHDVTNDKYAEQLLCYDCTAKLVVMNKEAASKYIKKGGIPRVILVELTGGFLFGFFKGFAIFFMKGAKAGASLASGNFAGTGDAVKAFFKMFIFPVTAIIDTVTILRQMKLANAVIASDAQTLQETQDYLDYNQVIEKQDDGVELTELVELGGALCENTYAIAVLSKDERSARIELRKKMEQTISNGEVISALDAKKEKKKRKSEFLEK